MDLKERIKTIRQDKRMSQTDVARLVGIEPNNYSQLEKRGNRLTYEYLEKFAAAFEMSIGELLVYESPPDEGLVRKLEKQLEEKQQLIDLFHDTMIRLNRDSDMKQHLLSSALSKTFRYLAEDITAGTEVVAETYLDDEGEVQALYTTLFSEEDVSRTVHYLYNKEKKLFYHLVRIAETGLIDEEEPFIKALLGLHRKLQSKGSLTSEPPLLIGSSPDLPDKRGYNGNRKPKKGTQRDTPNGVGHTENGAQEPDIGVDERVDSPGKVTTKGHTAGKSRSKGL